MATSSTEMVVPARLLNKLASVRRRKMLVGIAVALLAAMAVFALSMVGAMFIDWTFTLFEPTWRLMLLVMVFGAAIVTMALGTIWTFRRAQKLTDIAADIDREVPQLQERWSTVTEISDPSSKDARNVHPAMMGHVTEEALQWEPRIVPENVVSWRKMRQPLAALAIFGLILFLAFVMDWRQTMVLLGRFWLPNANISMTTVDGLDDVVVARGEELSINAALTGRTVDEATIFLRPHDGDEERQLLFPRGDAPQTVRYRQRSAANSFEYRIRAGDGQSDWHGVVVADRPLLAATTVRITPPAYTRRDEQELRKLPEKLSAVEGSTFEIAFQTEEAVRSFQLQFGDESLKKLDIDDNGWYRWQTVLGESFALSPILTEPNGLTNSHPPVCLVDVLADQAPEVHIITPDSELAVRPDDTINIEFEAKDDFGISRAELVVYNESDLLDDESREIMTIEIPLDLAGNPKEVDGEVQLDLSQLDLKDGESISYAVRVHDTREMSSEGTPNANLASTSGESQGQNGTQPNEASASSDLASSSELANSSSGDNRMPMESNDSQQPQSSPSSPAENLANSNQGATEADQSASDSQQGQAEVSSSSAFPGQESVADASTDDANSSTDTNEASESATSSSSANQQQSPSQQTSDVASADQTGQTGSQGQAGGNSQANAQSGESQPNGSPSSGSGNSPSQNSMASSNNQPSSNSSNQSSRPADNMTRRSLDVGTSQSGSSNRMSLTIDRWAGSFDGQSREKVELAIAPMIEELDQHLEQAEDNARGLLDELAAGSSWLEPQSNQLQSADDSLEKAHGLIEDLALKTEETPYAFVGLTLFDIDHSQISPAREEFWNAKQSEDTERIERIRAGWRYVQRARQLLAALTKQYEKVQRDYQLAESVEHIKQMYEVFIENAHALLGAGGVDDLGGLQRKMAEFELDEEYLARLKEVLEMRQEMMAEFARMLSDDPRLLRRYMDRLRARSKTLRYELAELTDRQKALAREVRAFDTVDEGQRDSLIQTIVTQKLLDVEGIATAVAELDERFRIWLPLDIEILDGSLAEARDLAEQAAASSRELVAAASAFGTAKKSTDESGDTSTEETLRSIYRQSRGLSRQLGSLDAALRRVSIEDDRQDLAAHLVKRLAETQEIISQTDGWMRKIEALAGGNYHLAAEVEQHQLTIDTAQLAGKLSDIEAQLAGSLQTQEGSLPEPIAEKAQQLMTTLDEEVATNQLSAVYALSENNMSTAIPRQSEAVSAMQKAEQLLQELLTMAITEMDKLPVQDPIASALEDPTLDELLAALEQELDSADNLGIPPRPSNLNVIGDMMMPGQPGQGGGSGMMGMGMQLGQANQQLQQAFEKTYQEALGRALKEKRITRSSAAKHLRRLSNQGAKRWRVGSDLGDDLLQGSGKVAPEQYRQAIEQYFEQISQLREEQADATE